MPGMLSKLVREVIEELGEGAAKSTAKKATRKAAKPVAKAVEKPASLAAKPAAKKPLAVKPKVLPSPPKQLALPSPGPGLPEFAVKPKGGQWWADTQINGVNYSPEQGMREAVPPGLLFSSDPRDHALRDWFKKAGAKYMRNDMGTPEDPLRGLAEQGLLHIPEYGPDDWSRAARGVVGRDNLQDVLYYKPPRAEASAMPGAGSDLRGEAMVKMPWLAKLPATETVHGIYPGAMEDLKFTHIADEMRNAMSAEAHGIPADLAVRPEMLERMSFPQAVERVGRINQFRAKQAEEAALSNLDSPAVSLFKEYPENNPKGLRWVELRAPESIGDADPTAGWELRPYQTGAGFREVHVVDPSGRVVERYDAEPGDGGEELAREFMNKAALERARRGPLQEALKYEGDTMGHCVGGYCDDVLSGRSRIFSLRDARGEPHVTIETSPVSMGWMSGEKLDEVGGPGTFDRFLAQRFEDGGTNDMHRWFEKTFPDGARIEDIVQIKGKQNRAPVDEYLPFVQDFVKSQKWGKVGDFANTQLVKLPDGRYITKGQLDEVMNRWGRDTHGDRWDEINAARKTPLSDLANIGWDGGGHPTAPYFEGYAYGGRVDADRCMCDKPLSVRRE